MAKSDTFQLDISGAGQEILQSLAASTAKQAADAIGGRANAMASAMDSDAPTFEVFSSVGTIKRGQRAIATVKANTNSARQRYVAFTAINKAKDAGRLN